MERIIQDIKNGQFQRVYLLYGNDEYSRIFYRNKLKNALISEDDTMNLSEFSGKDTDLNTIMDTARTIPFFGERRVVIVTGSALFGTEDKSKRKKKKAKSVGDDSSVNNDGSSENSEDQKSKRKKKSSNGLLEFISEIPDTTVLIFCEEFADDTDDLFKAVEKYGHAANFRQFDEKNPRDMQKLQGFILQKIKRENKNITNGAMRVFLERTGTDLQVVFTELDKLLAYTMNREFISEDDVKALVPERIEDRVYDMIDLISAKEQKQALDLYYDLKRTYGFQKGNSEFTILTMIGNHFNQIYLVKELSKTGMDYKEIMKAAAFKTYSEYVYKKYLNLSRKFTIEDLKKAINMCLEYEGLILSGQMKKEISVEMIIVAMSSREQYNS